MAAVKLTITLALFTAALAEGCQVGVEVLYPASAGGRPVVSCESSCDATEDKEATYFSGVAFKRFPDLAERYSQMVALEYEGGAFTQCSLVPFKTAEELSSEKAACAGSDENHEDEKFTCPEDFTLVGDYCFLVTPEAGTMNAGAEYCMNKDAAPAVIESQEEMDLLAEFLTTSVYLGTNDIGTEGTFINPGRESVTYLNFNVGEPNNVRNEDCVVAKHNKGFKWNDVKCTKSFQTLCQVVATEVKELEFVCQDGEKFGEDSCFLAPGASFAGSYDDAVQFCSANGMQLAAVHSQEEHDFVKTLLEGNTWIGFSDSEVEGLFTWASGADAQFTNWYANEPNNLGGEDCTEMRQSFGYQWNDDNCDKTDKQFLCRGTALLM